MRKQFVSNLALLLLVNFLVKPLWIFGIDLQVQNAVGAEQYGLYAAVFSLSIIFNIVLDLGFSHYSNRSMAQEPERLSIQFSRLFSFKMLLGGIYLLIALFSGFWLGYWQEGFLLLLLLAFNQFLLSLIVFFRAHLAGLHHFRSDALMSVLDKTLTILLCGLVLYGVGSWQMTIVLFAGLQTVSFMAAAVVGFFLVWRKTRYFKPQWRMGQFRKHLSYSLPYALLILLMALYTRIDSVMLQQMAGAFENGVYAQAFRLLDAVNQPGYLFAVLLLPMFSGMLSRNEPVTELSRLSFSLLLVLTTALSLGSAHVAPQLMDLLYHEHPELSSPVFQLLIFSSIAFGSTYIFGTLLTAQGNLRLLNWVAFGGFVLNVILNLSLIPIYGAWGAALATVLTQSLAAIVQLWLSLRLASLQFGGRFWARLLLFVTITGLLSFPAMHWLEAVAWPLAMLAIMTLTTVLGAAAGMLPLREGWSVLQSRIQDTKSS